MSGINRLKFARHIVTFNNEELCGYIFCVRLQGRTSLPLFIFHNFTQISGGYLI